MKKLILHCDLNNFFASVNLLSHPEYRDMPVAVGGDEELRHGVILAKNEIAKKYNVQTGEPLHSAKKKCKDLIILKPQYDDYAKYSKTVFNIYTRYTDRVERFGIDECFLDLTNSEKILGLPFDIATNIKDTVKAETGLTISVGISFTKAIAKLGSDLKKPDAITSLLPDEYFDKIKNLPANFLIYIGSKIYRKLNNLNIFTIGDLYYADDSLMKQAFGSIGKDLTNMARGLSDDTVRHYLDKSFPKSLSNGITTAKDMFNIEECLPIIYGLSENIAVRLREYNVHANQISVSLRRSDLSFVQKQSSSVFPIYSTNDIAENAIDLIKSFYDFSQPLRSISIGVSKFISNDISQLTLFNTKQDKFEQSIDSVRKKYGFTSITRGVVKNKIASELLSNSESDFKPFG